MKKILLLAFLSLLLSTAMIWEFIRPVEASGTIYIRADGSIEGTTDISTVDNITYTFIGNIYDEIVVQRDNIVVDGAGYTVQGTQAFQSTGIELNNRNNVTLKNVEVTNFTFGIGLILSSNNVLTGNTASSNIVTGIFLDRSNNNTLTDNTASNNQYGIILDVSSNNTITGNTASNNTRGIWLDASSNNTLVGNNASNNEFGIYLISSSNNTLTGNTASNNNEFGIYLLDYSSNNTITGNTASSNNEYGIYLVDSSNNNLLTGNNFVDNTEQVYSDGSTNVWDDGVEGNYWSDYEEKYPDAQEIDGSGIWDTPYVIDENNQDNYPIVPEFPTWTSMLLTLIVITVAIAIYKRRLLKIPN